MPVDASPWCIDPDNIQVAEVMALRVQEAAAGATLGPDSVSLGFITGFHFQLFHHGKTQN